MKPYRLITNLLASVALISLLLTACAPSSTPTEEVEQGPIKVRVAALPILDTLPMYVAQQEGLFAKHGVEIEFIPAGSAPKRDELINAGQADAMINEIVSTMFYNKETLRVQIVRYARTATADSPLFRILASESSGIESIEGLKGVQIGVSKGTVIEYLTDRLLQKEGFTADEIQTISVPDIGQRMALLASGELEAGMLPDPLSTLAVLQGSKVILDDTAHPEFSNSVYSFRKEYIDQHPQAVKGFLAAIEEAVGMINADPQGWNNLLVEQKLVPEPLISSFELPQFVTSGVPSMSQWTDVLGWALDKGLLSGDVPYKESVTTEYLP
jgi:NitT/TauT family transport system substrate-binding protein